MRIVTLAFLAFVLGLVGCGRKGSLEVPTGSVATTGPSRTDRVDVREVDVREQERAPALGSRTVSDVRVQTSDIRGRNADAPEPGDAIPEGPGVGASAPERRFILDPLL